MTFRWHNITRSRFVANWLRMRMIGRRMGHRAREEPLNLVSVMLREEPRQEGLDQGVG